MNVNVLPELLAAFGAEGEAVPLEGGEGLSFRVGELVLKRVHDPAEAEWVQEVLSHLRPDGFRVPQPVATVDGRWTHDGWAATRYVEGLRPLAPAWETVIDAGLRFCDAAEAARTDDGRVLGGRTHRWAVADRVAWGEHDVVLVAEVDDVRAALSGLLEGSASPLQIIHGDLAGNVHVDQAGTPVVLDFSPYLRPRRWAAAIVVADAVLWNDADVSLAASFAATREGRDLLGRALTFRLVAEALADTPRHGARLEPYRRVLAALG